MKNLIAFFALFSLFKGSWTAGGHDTWSYEGNEGPSEWPHNFFTCKGSRQSPINIEVGNVKKEYWNPLSFKNYDSTPTQMRIKNNGHTAQVELDGLLGPRVKEGGLKGEYNFAQLHFHWGRDSTMGSEHTIDGVRYPLEMHLVHYKSTYGDIKEAVKHPDGLAVLGVLFEVGASDNAAFAPIVRALRSIKEAGKVSDVDAKYPLSAYLPSDRESFFRYLGSLTTPTCNEVVIWTVFRKPVPISESQLQAFRDLMQGNGRPLVDNFRPPQQLRNRKVYVSASESAAEGSTMKKLGLAMYFMSTMAVLMMNM